MKDLNKKRAQLIFNAYGSGNCTIVVTDILKRFLGDLPSMIEYRTCKRKGCPKDTAYNIPVLGIHIKEFDNDMNNLQKAVIANLPTEVLCQKCQNPCTYYDRKCDHHLFIEVILIWRLILLNFIHVF